MWPVPSFRGLGLSHALGDSQRLPFLEDESLLDSTDKTTVLDRLLRVLARHSL